MFNVNLGFHLEGNLFRKGNDIQAQPEGPAQAADALLKFGILGWHVWQCFIGGTEITKATAPLPPSLAQQPPLLPKSLNSCQSTGAIWIILFIVTILAKHNAS